METRETLELLGVLPVDFISSQTELEPVPIDLLPEMSQEIMHRAPTKMTLFAQTSSYWRSYFYLRQLQDAVLMQLDEEQERILTNLLINSTLLYKEDAQRNLLPWIHYLKNYYGNNKINIKNRLLAQALLLIIDKHNSQRHWVEFEFVLKAYCFSMHRAPRHQLFHSLKAMVMATGSEVSIQELDLTFLRNPSYNCIGSVYEAQLILAPFASLGLLPIDFPSIIVKKIGGTWGWDKGDSSYVFLLHAALKLLPDKSDFWQHVQTSLPQIISRLPTVSRYSPTKLCAARIDLIATLFRATARNTTFWNSESLNAMDDMTAQQLSSVQDRAKAKKLCSLNNDQARVNWLAESFKKENLDWILFSFAPRVCAQLKSDETRAKAIDVLLSLIKVKEVGDLDNHLRDDNGKIIEVIRALVVRCQSAQIKMSAARRLNEMYYTNPECFYFWLVPFLFSFPLEEKHFLRLETEYLSLKHRDEHCDIRFLNAFFFSHQTAQQVDYWLKPFQVMMDSFSDKDYETSFCYTAWSGRIYTELLINSRNLTLLQQWQEKMYRLHLNDKYLFAHNAREYAMKILPYLTDERAIKQWMVVLMRKLKVSHGDLINGIFLGYFTHCINGLLPRLSPELRTDYCQQMKNILFPAIIDKSRVYYYEKNLGNLISLLQHLPDEMIVELASSPLTAHEPLDSLTKPTPMSE